MLAAGLLALAGCGALDAPERHATQVFPHTGGALTIRSSLGGLRIEQGAAGSVRVERWLRGKAGEDGNSSWSLKDGTLRLTANCTMVFGDCGGRYRLQVPPGTKLVVEASDGVIATGLGQDLDISARDTIRLQDTSGALRLRSEGPISGERLRSVVVRARTADGSISLGFATRPTVVEAVSTDGRVTATVPDGTYRVTAKSTDGTVRSQVKDGDSTSTIVARSGSGDVRIYRR